MDATDHISDQLCKAAAQIEKSIYNRVFLGDYAFLILSSVKAPKHLTNQFTHTLQQSQPRANSTFINTYQFDKRNNEYYSTLESSNDQLYYRSTSSPYKTWVPRTLYEKVAFDMQKQVCVFIENIVFVSLEESNFVIFMIQNKHFLYMTNKPCNSVKLDVMSVISQQDICYVSMPFYIKQWV